MRASRVLVGIVVVALIVWGILYLDRQGYFNRTSADLHGMSRDETPPPVPPVQPSTNSAASPSPTTGLSSNPDADYEAIRAQAEDEYKKEAQDEAQGRLPIGTARADYESTMRKAAADRDLAKKLQAQRNPQPNSAATLPPQSPNTQTSQAPWPKGAVSDLNGNPCIPVKARVRTSNSSLPRAPRSPRPMMEMPRSSPAATGYACSLWNTAPDGLHQVTLPAGMLINASLDRELGTEISQPGDQFNAFLVGPITYCGHVIVPAGAMVTGTVGTAHKRAALSEGDSTLVLKLDSLDANGNTVRLNAGSVTLSGSADYPLRSVTYDNGGREFSEVERAGRNIYFPANAVVSFWLQSSVQVNF